MEGRFVVYYRVSTDKQGKSGLGLEAQRETVTRYLNGGGWEIVGEYKEIESGKKADRPELLKAIRDCRLKDARLLVSKLDRLSRDVHFISSLKKEGIKFTVAEMPDATELTINIYAAMAEHERELISQRTRDALAPFKGTGKLGSVFIKRGERIPGSGGPIASAKANAVKKCKADAFALEISGIIKEWNLEGQSLREIAEALNNADYRTARNGEWHATSVKRILERAGCSEK